MHLQYLFNAIFGIYLLLFGDLCSAQLGTLRAASPSYSGRDACPARCSVSGPSSGNWSVYHNFEQFQSCPQTLFYQFTLQDKVDDPETHHRIYACSSYGPDWANMPNSAKEFVDTGAYNLNSTYKIGWETGSGAAAADLQSLVTQMRQYLTSGFAANEKNTAFLFGRSGNAAAGLRIGQSLHSANTGNFALQALENHLADRSNTFNSLAMQLCDPKYNDAHTFGFMATSNGSFSAIQESLRAWHGGHCVQFDNVKTVTGPMYSTSPLQLNTTNSTAVWRNDTITSRNNRLWQGATQSRATGSCRTVQVQQFDDCGVLAKKCGISVADVMKYNPSKDFCTTLFAWQLVCCEYGELPDLRPKPNADGSCATWQIHGGDTCASIAARNGITVEEIVVFNHDTWGWNGCDPLWENTIICLTKGTPPMPAPAANTVCGPQVPGTKPPAAGTDIGKLNLCPLNACCDVWGQCGTTSEFCTDTGTGAPGTARKGTNGCISNCGTVIVRGEAPAEFRKIGYFEGYNFGRKCLSLDARMIDTNQYTHIHFAFATITPDYKVHMPDFMTEYEFFSFKRLIGVKRILSFGGWDFSTSPSTYNIFRQGVTPANRLTLATNIANYIKMHDLDGVDIDWEYPSVSFMMSQSANSILLTDFVVRTGS